ncbi:nucleotidyltransferase domain-containing protein [Thermodesulfovibrio yellowstonii]|uniref:DNA polymerase n=1 Tax=Thermodesulfovibrio yellowstonii TaxID=28262 RepID=A0A9W6GHU0_9BACT|nr:nucleotidyltransferase domain-containing protein [Thermodesulfovibrio islandicus]GLI54292.1 DNA polymerase [Thermodesulfovibrio islandicus]
MGYREKYYSFIEKLKKEIIDFYGDRLVSLVIFGSVASDRFRPDSDIDILLIVKDLPCGRMKRLEEFVANIENKFDNEIREFMKENISITLSPLFKTPEEVQTGSPLFLDMTENCKILFDREKFFTEHLQNLKEKLNKLGAKKIYKKGGYYWLLKPDYKHGDIIEL